MQRMGDISATHAGSKTAMAQYPSGAVKWLAFTAGSRERCSWVRPVSGVRCATLAAFRRVSWMRRHCSALRQGSAGTGVVRSSLGACVHGAGATKSDGNLCPALVRTTAVVCPCSSPELRHFRGEPSARQKSEVAQGQLCEAAKAAQHRWEATCMPTIQVERAQRGQRAVAGGRHGD